MVLLVTPHSFRPGLAGDLLRAKQSYDVIMRICRWASRKVARMYAQRPALGSFLESSQFRVIQQMGTDYVARQHAS